MNKIQLWFAYFQLYNMDKVCHGFEGEKRSMNHIWIDIFFTILLSQRLSQNYKLLTN